MTKTIITAGPCNFKTTVEAVQVKPYVVELKIESDCEAVRKLAERLPELTMRDVLTKGFAKGPVYEQAAETLVHNSCPVASGILKAAEAAMKLALPKPAEIVFED